MQRVYVYHKKALKNNFKLATRNWWPTTNGSWEDLDLAVSYPKRTSIQQFPIPSTTVKRRLSILRGQEIMNHWYNAEICVQITQLENKPWKRKTAGFSQLRRLTEIVASWSLLPQDMLQGLYYGWGKSHWGFWWLWWIARRWVCQSLVRILPDAFRLHQIGCCKRENSQIDWNDRATCIVSWWKTSYPQGCAPDGMSR